MNQRQAFPIAIIDEDFEGRSAAGRGMRQLAAAIEKEGFRVSGDLSYEDARRLVNVFNNESCWLVSVDGTERSPTQWKVLEEVLAAKRARNDKLPIFLFGDVHTAEMVPASVLKHANAFMRLFEDSPEFMARVIARRAALSGSSGAADVQGADGLHAAGELFLAHARSRRRRRLPQEPGRATVLRVSSARTPCARTFPYRSARSARCSTTPVRSPRARRNAARIFGTDETLFVVGGTSTSNKIVWHGMVGRGDLVLCDRNCHKSILHSLIMTGATPIYLIPSRNGLGIIGPISKEQFTPESIAAKKSPARLPRKPAARCG